MFFQPNYNAPGPGVEKDTPRKKGLARLIELVARDIGPYWKAGMLALVGFVPGFAIAGAGLLLRNFPLVLAGGLAGGAIAGPGLAGLYDTVARTLRDEPGYWWHTYRRAFRANARAAVLPGALLGFLLSSLFLCVALLPAQAGPLAWATVMLCVFLLFGAGSFFWLQLVLMQLRLPDALKNSLLLGIGYLPRTLLAALVQLVYWGAAVLYFPISVPILLLTNAWVPTVIAALAVYQPLEATFRIEAQLAEKQDADTDPKED